jgi:uncharacterized membrane protein
MDSRDLSLISIIAVLYAVLVIVLAPISFGPVQLRIADCIIPLAALFGLPAVFGVTIGCFVSNMYYWLGFYDVFFGPLANFIAAFLIFLLRRKPILATILGSLPIGFIVGGYLWIFFPPPVVFGLNLPVWLAMMLSITISTLISLTLIGYPILQTMKKTQLIHSLRSWGVKIYENDHKN